MLRNEVKVRAVEEGFYIEARHNPEIGGGGVYFFKGHIRSGGDLEAAFRHIRDAIGKIAALA